MEVLPCSATLGDFPHSALANDASIALYFAFALLIHPRNAIGPFPTSPLNTATVGRIERSLVVLDFCYSYVRVFSHIRFGNPDRSRGVHISPSFLAFVTSSTNAPKWYGDLTPKERKSGKTPLFGKRFGRMVIDPLPRTPIIYYINARLYL